MQEEPLGRRAAFDARALLRDLAAYREPNTARAGLELVITVVPFVLIWAAIWVALDHRYWISLLLALPAAGFLVRLFIVLYDCGHASYFRSRRSSDWVGCFLGLLTLTPCDYWRLSHALHHASSGNLTHHENRLVSAL